jgi:hypothetical protein
MRNNENVVQGKLKLVQAFREARTELANQQLARTKGKETRKMETSAIKELVDYASNQGSTRPEWYYTVITKMTNEVLGIEPGQRDKLPQQTLDRLNLAETMVMTAIHDGLNAGYNYKDIYQLCKTRVKGLVPLLDKQ